MINDYEVKDIQLQQMKDIMRERDKKMFDLGEILLENQQLLKEFQI